MEAPTLKICVCDEVLVREGTFKPRTRKLVQSPYFRPEFRFTENKDDAWAPTRSRAPSVTIDFEFLNGDFS